MEITRRKLIITAAILGSASVLGSTKIMMSNLSPAEPVPTETVPIEISDTPTAVPSIETPTAEWPFYINKKFAEKDGLKPEDFRFDQWPVSNIHLRPVEPSDQLPSEIALIYRCDIPADTPQTNVYIEDSTQSTGYRKLPDPTGMALSTIKFELRDADTNEVLDEDLRNHNNGQVIGLLGNRAELWQRLTPGKSIRVVLYAWPVFFYLNEKGGVMAAYAVGNNGYFLGKEEHSKVYTLHMTESGNVQIVE